MAFLAQEIATFLEEENIGTVGGDIFIGDLTAREENGLYILNEPSPEPNRALQIYDQVIGFWTRYKKTNTGYAKLQEVQDLLHQRSNYLLTPYYVFFSHNMGMIEDMDRDVQRRKLHKLSVRFIYQPPIG